MLMTSFKLLCTLVFFLFFFFLFHFYFFLKYYFFFRFYHWFLIVTAINFVVVDFLFKYIVYTYLIKLLCQTKIHTYVHMYMHYGHTLVIVV